MSCRYVCLDVGRRGCYVVTFVEATTGNTRAVMKGMKVRMNKCLYYNVFFLFYYILIV